MLMLKSKLIAAAVAKAKAAKAAADAAKPNENQADNKD